MKTKLLTFFLALTLCFPLFSATVAADGAETSDCLFSADGVSYDLSLTTRPVELRRVWPSGVRFVTAVPRAQMDALLACEAVERIELGTRILPVDLLQGDDIMNAADALDVRATVGAWYASEDDCYLFAGSITDVKEANHNREFVGLGYARITLTDGRVLTVSADTLAGGTFGYMARAHLESFEGSMHWKERGYFEEVAAIALAADLADLDVLAIGDSLFDGDYLTGKQQWIGLLATECKWNLTNLGHDGWTVAYNPGVYAEGQRVRNSMYDYLFNRGDIYRFGGSNASHTNGILRGKTAEDVDLILLEGGVNDYGWNIPLGTVEDTDGSTLLGAWRLIIDKLLVDYPNAKIVFVTSWYVSGTKTTNGVQMDRMDYVCHGVKALFDTYYADEERFCVIDAGDPTVSGIRMAEYSFRANYAKSTSDTNHLNSFGMEMMQKFMRGALWELFAPAAQ